MTVTLGMPAAPPRSLGVRRHSRQIHVGNVPVGGDAPVSVQSMCTTLTADVNATLQQIAQLTAAGCQIVGLVGSRLSTGRRSSPFAPISVGLLSTAH